MVREIHLINQEVPEKEAGGVEVEECEAGVEEMESMEESIEVVDEDILGATRTAKSLKAPVNMRMVEKAAKDLAMVLEGISGEEAGIEVSEDLEVAVLDSVEEAECAVDAEAASIMSITTK